MDAEIIRIFGLFFDDVPKEVRSIDTSHGEEDFRAAFIIETDEGNKYVLKLADNDFTFPEKIAVWKRTVEEYRKLGYYCPTIFRDRTGGFPYVAYQGHRCAAYVEEFAPFRPVSDRLSGEECDEDALYETYKGDIWRMTARVAAQHFDYTDDPSAYCLFETFCPSDETDEVLDNALEWKKYADTLPEQFREQTERIWTLWTENRAALEPLYRTLPTSVFQADLNPTNILLDENGQFVGVYDFNLCGKDVFLNYLMRENYAGFEKEIDMIRDALKISTAYYRFSEAEKDAALMLYRCLKPLWYSRTEDLKAIGGDEKAVGEFLDKTEFYLTAEIDFRSAME